MNADVRCAWGLVAVVIAGCGASTSSRPEPIVPHLTCEESCRGHCSDEADVCAARCQSECGPEPTAKQEADTRFSASAIAESAARAEDVRRVAELVPLL